MKFTDREKGSEALDAENRVRFEQWCSRNVFIWHTRESDGPLRIGSRHGHQWIDWRKDNLEFCTVSDAAPADLERLQRLLTD
jgi:hypothetical protein